MPARKRVSSTTLELIFFAACGACAHQPSDPPTSDSPTRCHECTTVSGRVLSLDGEPISSADLLSAPRAAAPTIQADSLLPVNANGRFSLTLTGFGARPLLFGGDGFVATGTIIYADGSDVQLEVRLAKSDTQKQSSVAYLGPANNTRRLGELQDGALCHASLRECPPHARLRAMIEQELARAEPLPIRIALWVAYLSARESPAELHGRDEAYARQLLTTLDPTSWRWVEAPSALVVATRVTGDQDYFMRAFRQHPDPDMPLLLLDSARRAALEAGEQDEVERLDQLADDPRVKASKLNRVFHAEEALASRGPQPGDKLPSFAVTTISGDDMDDGHLPGKLTLIHFWGTWCGACKEDLPLFHELVATYGDAGFAIVSFAEDESPERVADFRADRWPMPWHHVVMTPGRARAELESAFELTAFPTWYLVDETQTIVLTSRHPADSSTTMRRDALREYLERHLRVQAEGS